ncbi:hypothetical protein SAMN04487866_12614 [Thermoactinomyces sp. DSM 45891]|uniref:antitoxin VbhA family protein n=1 Tax=Thermoactinomyces sp. DSM 45891 TaxID=1761907 RepID=UPI00091DE48E|nr:antitoxin VbhA family protein [Thermoactinomyces sp. DSM 45891]SFX79312.1 hypothetical protein SAMN04487866_12614 [Thermoactinomyces sp. DSM 45891]
MKRKWTEEQIATKLPNVKATMAFEGLDLTEEDLELFLARARGEITQKEYIKRAMESD